ncbi:MAG: phage holin family protein [Burkholderiaceae bacterium]
MNEVKSSTETRTRNDLRPTPEMRTNAGKEDRPLTALLSDLTRELLDLVRKELALARAEVSEKISSAQKGMTSLGLGAAVALSGLIIVLLAVANALERVLPPNISSWLAPLLVGLVALGIGYAMIKSGQSRLTAESLVPERTVNSLRTDRAVVEEKTR